MHMAVKCEYLLDVKGYPMVRVNTHNFGTTDVKTTVKLIAML